MELGFHDEQEFGRGGTPALQAIWDLCTKYNEKEPANLIEAQTNIEDGVGLSRSRISSLRRRRLA